MLTQLMFRRYRHAPLSTRMFLSAFAVGSTASWAGYTCCRHVHRPPHPWLEGGSLWPDLASSGIALPSAPLAPQDEEHMLPPLPCLELLPFPLWMARTRTNLLLLPHRVRALFWACRALWVSPLSCGERSYPVLFVSLRSPGSVKSVQGLLRTRASPRPLSLLSGQVVVWPQAAGNVAPSFPSH